MKLVFTSAAFLALSRPSDAAGVGTFFTYYEEGGLGPSRWQFLEIDGNQCGGTNGASGYGQSPVTIDNETVDRCNTDMSAYSFEKGTCKWGDLEFSISNNGVMAGMKEDSDCSFGRMNIPHSPNKFNALQFHIHTYSEHEIEGQGDSGFFPAELHVVHQEETEESYAVFGTMIDVGPADHPDFEYFLQGWEAVAQSVEDSCAKEARNLRLLAETSTVQEKVQCAKVGSATYFNASAPDFPNQAPNLYELPTNPDFGTFTYKGGLTTPGCTEIVNWNLLDVAMEISANQLARLEKLVMCYVGQNEDGTCSHATVADQAGSTSRPPQPLLGRRVVHRCRDGPPVEIDDVGVVVSKDDSAPFVKPGHPEENPNTKDHPCNKHINVDCSADPRYNPNVSPNIRANAPVWNDAAGLWVGTMKSYGPLGQPLEPSFASEQFRNSIPYKQDEIMIFVNRTIFETRYFEHVYYVYDKAPEEFCALPVPDEASNSIGKGVCGFNGYTTHGSRYGTSTHEKDGSVQIFFGNGLFEGTESGKIVPTNEDSFVTTTTGAAFAFKEAEYFINDEKTKASGSGQFFQFSDFPPYSENPLAESYVYQLEAVSAEDFVSKLNAAYGDVDVPKSQQVPAEGDCIEENCPTEDDFEAYDPLTTETPYQEDAQMKPGAIAGIVIVALAVVFALAYFYHDYQLKNQAHRFKKQFFKRMAADIKLQGGLKKITMEQLEQEFKNIDKDGDGMLSKEELRSFMGSKMSTRDFEAMFRALDVDSDGTVKFTEFCGFVAHIGEDDQSLFMEVPNDKDIKKGGREDAGAIVSDEHDV